MSDIWLARVSVGFARGVFAIFGSARGVFLAQHGVYILARVNLGFTRVQLLLHRSCNFPSSEVGNLILSQYSGLL